MPVPKRILILGPNGAGKSTLAVRGLNHGSVVRLNMPC